MKIETKFDIGQEVFWLDVKNDRALHQFVNSIKAEVYKILNGGLGISAIYYLVPAQIWVYDFHLFTTRAEAEREMEKMEETIKQQSHYTILPEKIGLQVCPFSTRWRLAHEQLLHLNKWIDKQFPIDKDERQD